MPTSIVGLLTDAVTRAWDPLLPVALWAVRITVRSSYVWFRLLIEYLLVPSHLSDEKIHNGSRNEQKIESIHSRSRKTKKDGEKKNMSSQNQMNAIPYSMLFTIPV